MGRRRIADAALLMVLVAVFVVETRPAFASWFHMDDFRNLRWVLEYWSEPWRVFTERQALHGHVRPLHALTLWLATPKVGDPYLPQLAVLTALRAIVLLGFGALALRLGASRRAAIVTMLLGVSLYGFERLGAWVAWTCSAGQVALGTWALVALDHALSKGRRPWLALLLALGAGLYKEPGWLVVPLGALAVAAGRGATRRGLPFLLLGAAGFAWSWHPDNSTRYLAEGGGLLSRIGEGLVTLPATAFSGWPAWESGVLPGLPVVLVLAALWWPLPLSGTGRGIGWAVCTVAALASASVASVLVFSLAVATVLLRWRAPPLGLVLFVAEMSLSIPLDIRNEVQVVGGALGLTLHTVLVLSEVPLGGPWRVLPGIAAVIWGVPLVAALFPAVPDPPKGLDDRERLLGLAALVSAMGPAEAVFPTQGRISDPLLPMTGLFERTQLANPASVSVGDYLLLNPPPDAVEHNLVGRSRVSPNSVPWLGERWDDGLLLDARKHPRNVPEGWYAIGLGPSRLGGRTFGSAVHALDDCGHRWTAASPAPDVAIALEIVHLRPGCGGLSLVWTGEQRLEAMFILAPLTPDPLLSAGRGQPIQRVLDVTVHADPELGK